MPLTRRSALASVGIGLLAACTSHPRKASPPPVDPDVALKLAAVDRERALLAAYDQVIAAQPGLAARLAPLRADHAAHLAALGAGALPTAAPAPAAGLPALRTQEHATAAAHAAAALPASPALAAVLASLAACEASHVVAL